VSSPAAPAGSARTPQKQIALLKNEKGCAPKLQTNQIQRRCHFALAIPQRGVLMHDCVKGVRENYSLPEVTSKPDQAQARPKQRGMHLKRKDVPTIGTCCFCSKADKETHE
jgi:hypothetical protein